MISVPCCENYQRSLVFVWVTYLTHFRTGAWHPLLKIDGCLCTLGTRSNGGPVNWKTDSRARLFSSPIGRKTCMIYFAQGGVLTFRKLRNSKNKAIMRFTSDNAGI